MKKKVHKTVMFLSLLAWILSNMALVATAAKKAPTSPPAQTQSVSAKVDINTANAQELATLPGIGPSIAQRIVDHRQAQGPFKSIEDLKSVKGIGEKKFAAIKDMVTVSKP